MLIQNAFSINAQPKLARSHRSRGEPRTGPQSLPLLATPGKPTRILIVDSADSTDPLQCLLHALGYWQTRTATCGETGLEMALDFLPSVVLLGLDLPAM